MTIFFTSDTHFGHARIVELSNRPFAGTKRQTAVEVMNDALVENWNSVVSEGDTVFHLGDVALGPIAESLTHIRRLNGYKILVEGNHDRRFMAMQQGKAEKAERERERYLNAGFDEVHDNLRIAGFGDNEPVALSHFPYTGDHFDGDRFEHARQEDNGLPIVHGHTHSDRAISYSAKGTLQIHVGVDTWNFAPVSYERITQIIRAVTP
jgi:calcineurin-like phosphoesterase family protein